MSKQFLEHIKDFKMQNVTISNKKKNLVKDGLLILKAAVSPLHCQACGKPKGKLLWCKHVYLMFRNIFPYSLEQICLIAANDKYINLEEIVDEECCICLDKITKLEEQCLQCGHLLHTRCLKQNIINCPICQYSLKKKFSLMI